MRYKRPGRRVGAGIRPSKWETALITETASKFAARLSDGALGALVGVQAALATRRRPSAARLSRPALVGLGFVLVATQPAQAQIIETGGSEMFTWVSTIDVNIVPLAITAGVLVSMVTAAFNRMAGAAVFIGTVAGAFMYGARDELIAAAGGAG
jgi:hypothetical protein